MPNHFYSTCGQSQPQLMTILHPGPDGHSANLVENLKNSGALGPAGSGDPGTGWWVFHRPCHREGSNTNPGHCGHLTQPPFVVRLRRGPMPNILRRHKVEDLG